MNKISFLSLNSDAAVNERLKSAFGRVLDSGYFINGPEVERFEKQFAKFCGSTLALGISNGLDALFLSLKALNIQPGDKVVVPAHTFIATWLAVSQAQATLIPVDADRESGQIDLDLLEKTLSQTPGVKAVIVVHLYGLMADMDRILSICQKYKIALIEDAAQAHGSSFKGKKSGSFGDVAAFSFYPGKNLGGLGDAGAVTTSRTDIYETVKKLRNYGSSKKYHHDVMGYNHRLDELQAAFLNEKLVFLDRWNQQRVEQVQVYQSKLTGLENIRVLKPLKEVDPSWHLYVIRTPYREALMSFLAEKKIETLIHYPIACHLSQAYSELNYKKESFPVSAEFAGTCLSLPLGPHLSLNDIEMVCDAVIQFTKS